MRTHTFKLAVAVFAATSALMMTACEDGQADDGPEPDEGCERDTDCLGGQICDKENDGDDIPAANDEFGVCIQVACIADSQCGEEEKCDLRRGICIPKNLCEPNDPAACPNAGDVCQYNDGLPLCAPAPAATECQVAPSPGYVSAGESLQLEGTGFKSGGTLAPHTTFTWAITAGADKGSIAANGVLSANAAATAGDITVEGTTVNGGAKCSATVKVYGAVPAGSSRVVVIDLATRQPIANAPVAVRVGGNNTNGTTGADGSFTFAGAADAESVSVFPPNHQWHTLIDPPNDAIIFTASIQNTDFVDGIKGTFDFSKVKTVGDIKLGLAGTAINAAITDLNFSTIIGEFVPSVINIEGIADNQEVNLPEGLIIGLGQEDFKGDYAALSDKQGKSVAWALAGRVPLGQVGPIIQQVSGSGADDLDFGKILGAVLPFFAKFDHAVVTGLDFQPAARTANDPNFETVTIRPNTLLSQSVEYTMPKLPCAPGQFASAGNCTDNKFTSGAVLLTGVIVPGQGLVPLGISAGLDVVRNGQAPDGVIEQADGPGAGKVLLDYAPPHDGIEGAYYVTVAIAIDIDTIADSDSSDLGASIITKIARTFDATNNTFPAATFLESQGGTFTAGTAGGVTLEKKGNADFYRVNLDNNGDLEWNVWFKGDNQNGFTIANLAQNSTVNVADRTQHADMQAFKLGTGYDGPAPSNFDDLFGFDGQDIDNLLLYLGGWSSESCKAGGLCAEN